MSNASEIRMPAIEISGERPDCSRYDEAQPEKTIVLKQRRKKEVARLKVSAGPVVVSYGQAKV